MRFLLTITACFSSDTLQALEKNLVTLQTRLNRDELGIYSGLLMGCISGISYASKR